MAVWKKRRAPEKPPAWCSGRGPARPLTSWTADQLHSRSSWTYNKLDRGLARPRICRTADLPDGGTAPQPFAHSPAPQPSIFSSSLNLNLIPQPSHRPLSTTSNLNLYLNPHLHLNPQPSPRPSPPPQPSNLISALNLNLSLQPQPQPSAFTSPFILRGRGRVGGRKRRAAAVAAAVGPWGGARR